MCGVFNKIFTRFWGVPLKTRGEVPIIGLLLWFRVYSDLGFLSGLPRTGAPIPVPSRFGFDEIMSQPEYLGSLETFRVPIIVRHLLKKKTLKRDLSLETLPTWSIG